MLKPIVLFVSVSSCSRGNNTLFNHTLTGEHLCYFQFGVAVDKSALNIFLTF